MRPTTDVEFAGTPSKQPETKASTIAAGMTRDGRNAMRRSKVMKTATTEQSASGYMKIPAWVKMSISKLGYMD
jgi:hypothetical protein